MEWIAVNGTAQFLELLFGRFMSGDPPRIHEVAAESDRKSVYTGLASEPFLEEFARRFWPGGMELEFPNNPSDVNEGIFALLRSLNHMTGRMFEPWPPDWQEWEPGRDSEVELPLGGLAPVGPGGRIRAVTTSSSTVRICVAARPTVKASSTTWLRQSDLQSRLFPALSLLDNPTLSKRVAYGYHELSLHAYQRTISAAVVVAISQIEPPRWRTLFVQPVTANPTESPPMAWQDGQEPDPGPEFFDNCQ
jgi:hypothetical protein